MSTPHELSFHDRIRSKQLTVGVVGLGYVGLPLSLTFVERGNVRAVGFDIDASKVEKLGLGQSYLHHIPSARIAGAVQTQRYEATTDFSRASHCDALVICVPTPLTPTRDPDLSFIQNTTEALAPHVRRGQLIVLESTTYPGTTDEVVRPILERGGLVAGVDFHLAFSPEREDPGNPDFTTSQLPKIVGGHTPACLEVALALYGLAFQSTVPVSSTRTAEMVKLLENIYRSVNIALVNELKMLCHRMGLDVFEVIAAAATKPFGFQAFYPGPGLGGHCIPIDPFYLSWKARELEFNTRFIELAGEVNQGMPGYVVQRTVDALNERTKPMRGARVLVVGIAYKPDVDDMRESPALRIIELCQARGAKVDYFDPLVPEIPKTREHPKLAGRSSITWTAEALSAYDAAIVVTNHSTIDYAQLAKHSLLVVDTRNAVGRRAGPNVVAA
jgi:UDP-N-acetyl-D-glucosamine dehydrogenase